jgi:hypothetical protein
MRAGFKPWEGYLICAPVVTASVVREYANVMVPEALVTSIGAVAFGFSLVIARQGPRKSTRIVLSVAIVLACLTKPAFLFLAIACPAGIALITPALRRESVSLRELTGEFGVTLFAVTLPLVAYATLRLAIVGHLGIVSYGGVALAGLGTNPVFLTESSVERLPTSELRGLGRAILTKRHAVASRNTQFPQFVFDEDSLKHRPVERAWTEAFDPTIFAVALPAAREYYSVSQQIVLNPDWILINRKLGALSSTTIRNRFDLYLKWVALTVRSGFQDVFHYERGARVLIGASFLVLVTGIFVAGLWARRIAIHDGVPRVLPIVAAASSLVLIFNWEATEALAEAIAWVTKGALLGSIYPLFTVFLCFCISCAAFWRSVVRRRQPRRTSRTMAYAYGGFALLYFAAGIFLVSLVEMPLHRYVVPLSPFLQGAVLLMTVHWVRAVCGRGVLLQETSAL